MEDAFIQRLKEKLSGPLPGVEAQYRMAHVVRRRAVPAPDDARQAGVLALFYPKGDEWHLVFIERASSHPDDRHGGQISFPGGKYEEQDKGLQMTALREAEEEVGVDASQVEVLGPLTELYIPVSNFLVNPFVGFTTYRPTFRPQASEVRAILEVPFRLLQKSRTRRTTDLQLAQQIILRDVPFFDIYGKVLWGATAMMVNELLELLGSRQESL